MKTLIDKPLCVFIATMWVPVLVVFGLAAIGMTQAGQAEYSPGVAKKLTEIELASDTNFVSIAEIIIEFDAASNDKERFDAVRRWMGAVYAAQKADKKAKDKVEKDKKEKDK